MLRQALFIARADLRFLLGQRETLVWTFGMPIVFFYFIGTVTAGFGPSSGGRPDALLLEAPAGAGFLLDELEQRFAAQEFAVTRTVPEGERPPARRVTVPDVEAGLTASALAGRQVDIAFSRRGEGMGDDYDQIRLGRAVYGLVADLALLKNEGIDVSAESLRRIAERPRTVVVDVRTAGARRHVPTGFEQTIPGTLVMFTMMVLLTGGAVMLVIEREQGLLRRLASTPIPRTAVVLGKWVARMALASVQIAFGVLAGSLLFGMDWGHALPAVAAVLFGWAAFNASLALLAGNLARTQAQMGGLGALFTMTLAALGGCWWPIEITPDWMQSLALFLPTGWAMDALHRLVSFGQPGLNAGPHVAALLVSALALGALAARRFRYE